MCLFHIFILLEFKMKEGNRVLAKPRLPNNHTLYQSPTKGDNKVVVSSKPYSQSRAQNLHQHQQSLTQKNVKSKGNNMVNSNDVLRGMEQTVESEFTHSGFSRKSKQPSSTDKRAIDSKLKGNGPVSSYFEEHQSSMYKQGTTTNRRQSANVYNEDSLTKSSFNIASHLKEVSKPTEQNNLSSADQLAQIETAYSSKDNRKSLIEIGEECEADNLYETNDRQTAATSSSNHPFGKLLVVSVMKPTRALKLKVNNGKAGSQSLIDKHTLKNILDLQNQKEEFGFLQIDQIGICGIPSLFMSTSDLIRERHICKETISLLEKYHKMQQVLKAHRKWENEKMYGRILGGSTGIAQIEYQYFSSNKLSSKFMKDSSIRNADVKKGQISLQQQYQKSFYAQGLSYTESDAPQFKLLNSENRLIKQIMETNNVNQVGEESQNWSVLWSCNGLNTKPQIYESMQDFQKVNHFMNSTELTNKNKLTINFSKMRNKFGPSEFNYLPESYVLPDQAAEFRSVFLGNQHKLKSSGLPASGTNAKGAEVYNDNIWICKPAQSSRGRGIFLLTDVNDIPMTEAYVVSKYISDPLLINGFKFDLRIYVLITGFDPLKIYIYNEGLARFASEPYQAGLKGSKFSHLTNYSINKKNEHYVQNKNTKEQDHGNKWSLSALQSHLKKLGIDVSLMWARIYDAVIKSIISAETQLFAAQKKSANSRSNCFELLGYDIMLDSELNPWILEVNLAPSLTADSPLDWHIKSNLAVDLFNLVGVRRPFKRNNNKSNSLQGKLKSNSLQSSQLTSQAAYGINGQPSQSSHTSSASNLFKAAGGRNFKKSNQSTIPSKSQNQKSQQNVLYDGVEIGVLERISKVSAKHRSQLLDILTEFERNTKLNFTRIFPSPGSSYYDQFFDVVRPNNKLVYKYLCQRTELWAIIEQSSYNDLDDSSALFEQAEKEEEKSLKLPVQPSQSKLDKHVVKDEAPPVKKPEKSPPRKPYEKTSSQSIALALRKKSNQKDEPYQPIQETHVNAPKSQRNDTESSIASPLLPPPEDTKIPDFKRKESLQRSETQESKQPTESQKNIVKSPRHGFGLSPRSPKNFDTTFQQAYEQDSRNKSAVKSVNPRLKTTANLTSNCNNLDVEIDTESKRVSKVDKLQNEIRTIRRQSANKSMTTSKTQDGSQLTRKSVSPLRSKKPERHESNRSYANSTTKKESDKEIDQESKKEQNKLEIKEVKEKKDRRESLVDQSRGSQQSIDKNSQVKTKSNQQTVDKSPSNRTTSPDPKDSAKKAKKKKEKVVITGDDILIEYVRRIKNATKKTQADLLPNSILYYLEKFLNHKVWTLNEPKLSPRLQQEFNQGDLFRKIKIRYIEMKQRREAVKKTEVEQKQGGKTPEQIIKATKLRNEIVAALSSQQVEQMVIQSNLQNPIEIVSFLVGKSQDSIGILTRIERFNRRLGATSPREAKDRKKDAQILVNKAKQSTQEDKANALLAQNQTNLQDSKGKEITKVTSIDRYDPIQRKDSFSTPQHTNGHRSTLSSQHQPYVHGYDATAVALGVAQHGSWTNKKDINEIGQHISNSQNKKYISNRFSLMSTQNGGVNMQQSEPRSQKGKQLPLQNTHVKVGQQSLPCSQSSEVNAPFSSAQLQPSQTVTSTSGFHPRKSKTYSNQSQKQHTNPTTAVPINSLSVSPLIDPSKKPQNNFSPNSYCQVRNSDQPASQPFGKSAGNTGQGSSDQPIKVNSQNYSHSYSVLKQNQLHSESQKHQEQFSPPLVLPKINSNTNTNSKDGPLGDRNTGILTGQQNINSQTLKNKLNQQAMMMQQNGVKMNLGGTQGAPSQPQIITNVNPRPASYMRPSKRDLTGVSNPNGAVSNQQNLGSTQPLQHK